MGSAVRVNFVLEESLPLNQSIDESAGSSAKTWARPSGLSREGLASGRSDEARSRQNRCPFTILARPERDGSLDGCGGIPGNIGRSSKIQRVEMIVETSGNGAHESPANRDRSAGGAGAGVISDLLKRGLLAPCDRAVDYCEES